MPKWLRSSERKEAQEQEQLDNRAEVTKKSFELQKIIEENKESLDKEIERLCSIYPEQPSSDESVLEKSQESDTEEEFESPRSRFVSENSLVWDQHGDLESPLKDTSDILDTTFQYSDNQDSLPPALNRGRSVSVSVNRADYSRLESGELVELHPVCKDSARIASPGLISQDSFLERNLQAKQVEVFSLIGEEDLDAVEIIDIEVGDTRNKMDSGTFKEHVVKLKNDVRKVMRKINDYTATEVRIADSQDFKENLKVARKAFEEVREALDKVVDELDPDTEKERINELENIMSGLTSALKKNECEVKDKMTEILDQATANKPRSEDELKKEEHTKQKLIKRIGFLKEKALERRH